MAVTRRTLTAIRDAKAAQNMIVDGVLIHLARSWGAAWAQVVAEWEAAIAELLEVGAGQWPTPRQVREAQLAANALKVTTEALTVTLSATYKLTVAQVPDLARAAVAGQEAIARSQLPAAHVGRLTWEPVKRGEVSAIVQRATQRIHSQWPLSRQAEAQMKATLIRGVTVGENPRRAAARMLERVAGNFNGGRWRAETLATTEMLDAHRAAAQASRVANADVLTGWTWLATLDKRTCPACLSLNGSKHAAGDFGPEGHQRCRCTAVPDVRSWRSLGIDMDEPHTTLPDAKEWFDKQPRDAQAEIMGQERLRQYHAGQLRFTDMAVKVSTPGWRDSWRVRALNR